MEKLLSLVYPPFPGKRASVGLLLLRLFFGFGIMLHGLGKLRRGPEFIEKFAAGVGVPEFMGWLAVLTEFGGGILIMLGLLTPMIALMLTVTMTVAALKHISGGDAFLLKGAGNGMYTVGWEFASLYLFAFAALLFMGPGRLAADFLLLRKKVRS